MKGHGFIAMTILGFGVALLGVGLTNQRSNSEQGNIFSVQSVNERSRDQLGDFRGDQKVIADMRDYTFLISSDDGGANLQGILTTTKREQNCKDSDFEWVNSKGDEMQPCGDGVLKTENFIGEKNESKSFLKSPIGGDENGDIIKGDVLISDNSRLFQGKVVGLEAYSLDDDNRPVGLSTISYSDSDKTLSLSYKKVSKDGVSTVYQKTLKGSRESSLGIGQTEDGGLYFVADDTKYPTGYTVSPKMFVGVSSVSLGAGLDNITFSGMHDGLNFVAAAE